MPSVTNVYYFFMNCRAAGHFVRCCFVYVIVCYGAANCQCRVVSAWCRALVCCRSSMVPRSCILTRTRAAALHGSAHLHAAAHPWCCACGQMVSSSSCFRAPMVPRAEERYVVLACVAAHLPWCRSVYVRPRFGPSLPRSSPYCRALSHVAAQCYMLPRTHGAARGITLHRLRAAQRFESSPLLPRSGLDCYKRAARFTVGVSRSAALVEV